MVGTYVGTGWMGIAPSRFGYFGSALPKDATPARQAEVYVELLDHLGVDRAVAMGYSAGGKSVIELALRRPDRLRALVLTASALPPSGRPPVVLAPLFSAITRTNRIFWALKAYMPGVMRGVMGVPKGYEPTPAEEESIREVGESIFPVTARRKGFVFDAFTGNTWVRRCHLEDIAVPTLIVHAADDTYAPYQHAVAAADRIPGVEFVTIDKGGHLFLGREAAVREAVAGFLGRQLQPK
jgi:pimeloyl-ACP methyl ester carboxylesterase